MTEDKHERQLKELQESVSVLLEDISRYLNRDLELLDSPSSHSRFRGIEAVTRDGKYQAVPKLVELLDDEAPIIWDDLVTEVRQCALTGLQRLHWAARLPLELPPVLVRRPWPLADMRGASLDALDELSESERENLIAKANDYLERRVVPDPDKADDMRAYRVLQELGRVPYQRQEVDPTTTLTPLQEAFYAEQVATPRPRPCLRVGFLDRPDKTLGWIYRRPGERFWAHDFSEHPAAMEASEALSRIQTLGGRGIPRVVHDEAGRPQRDADGKFVLDGVLVPESGDVLESLRSIAAFMGREFATELLLPGDRNSGS